MNNLPSNNKPNVIFLPGGVTPAELSYGPLLKALGDQIQPYTKDLEVYTNDAPPPNYGLGLEVEGLRSLADTAGLDRFHLVGYSTGGAVSLAFAAQYPERLSSLALVEPAWIGKLTPEDAADWAEISRLMQLPPDQRMPAFVRWHMRPGVEPPVMQMPPGPPPPWMARRPAGLEAIFHAYNTYQLDQNHFRQMDRPVYFALGGLSTSFFEREAKTLGGLFPDMQVEVYEGRSHFDPPHRAEPERFARALSDLWRRSLASAKKIHAGD